MYTPALRSYWTQALLFIALLFKICYSSSLQSLQQLWSFNSSTTIAIYIYAYRGVDDPERSGAAFRHLVFSRNARSGTYWLLPNQPDRFVLSVSALICNGPKKVIQYFAEEETWIFPEIIKKVISKFFLERSGTSEFTCTPLNAHSNKHWSAAYTGLYKGC